MGRITTGSSLSLRTSNKLKRQALYVSQKKAVGKARHEERHRRRKEEANDPELRKQRLEQNQPASIDKKRIWDDVDDDSLGAVVDVAQLKRRRLEEAEAAAAREADGTIEDEQEEDDNADSMLDSDEEEESEEDVEKAEKMRRKRAQRTPSIAPSTTSTNLDLMPDSLTAQFRHLFSDELPPYPKILVTTSLNATIHKEAQEIAALFPNSEFCALRDMLLRGLPLTTTGTYIRRSAHRYSHKYSIKEIAKFAKSESPSVPYIYIQHAADAPSRPRVYCSCCSPRRPEAPTPAHHCTSKLGRRRARSDPDLFHQGVSTREVHRGARKRHEPLCMIHLC